MNDGSGPAHPRTGSTASAFLADVGNVWIGLWPSVASDGDKARAIATFFKLDTAAVSDWVSARGRVQCCARTGRQNRCLNLVGTHVEFDPRAWVQRIDLCGIHSQ